MTAVEIGVTAAGNRGVTVAENRRDHSVGIGVTAAGNRGVTTAENRRDHSVGIGVTAVESGVTTAENRRDHSVGIGVTAVGIGVTAAGKHGVTTAEKSPLTTCARGADAVELPIPAIRRYAGFLSIRAIPGWSPPVFVAAGFRRNSPYLSDSYLMCIR